MSITHSVSQSKCVGLVVNLLDYALLDCTGLPNEASLNRCPLGWDSTSTSLTIDNSPIINTYVDPDNYRQIYIDAGSINLNEKEINTFSGAFDLKATVDQSEMEISGEFKAIKSK